MSCMSCDVQMIKGDSLDIEFIVKESGAPFNLTGWNAVFECGEVLKKTEIPAQGVITEPLNGKGVIYLKPTDTSNIPHGYEFTIAIYNSTDKYTFICGKFTFVCNR